jgi:hypothetical protein
VPPHRLVGWGFDTAGAGFFRLRDRVVGSSPTGPSNVTLQLPAPAPLFMQNQLCRFTAMPIKVESSVGPPAPRGAHQLLSLF